jgi:hypothetical protein
MRRTLLRATMVAAATAPLVVLGVGAATAAPTLTTGGAGEVVVGSVPLGESWLCVALGGANLVQIGGTGTVFDGYTSASTVTATCVGPQAPFVSGAAGTAG